MSLKIDTPTRSPEQAAERRRLSQERRAAAAGDKAAGTEQASEVLRQIAEATTKIRIEMTKRYNVEF